MEERQNLFNIEAEQTILGVIILNNDYLERVLEVLHEEYFYEPVHQKIYRYILETATRSSIAADSITLKLFFENDDTIKKIGGKDYLTILLKSGAGVVDIRDYALIVKDLAIKRRLVLSGESIVSEVYKESSKLNSKELIEKAESDLYNISIVGDTSKGFIEFGKSVKDTTNKIKLAMERDNGISGIPVNLTDVDSLFGGFQNSDLIIIGGRPSMGKSALAINFAYQMAKELQKQKKSVGFLSLEMPAEQITARILAMETGISSSKFRSGEIGRDEYDKIVLKADEIEKVPLYIDDTAALSISAIRTKTRRMVKQKNMGVLFVDYLQLAKGTNSKQALGNRVLEIGEITMGLKAIAKDFNIPVVALSQLSRPAKGEKENKKPQLTDLRESGNIEQDADIVMFIHREEYYEERRKPNDNEAEEFARWQNRMENVRNQAEIIVAKHRNGAIKDLTLYFNSMLGKFSDFADDNRYGNIRR
ncbi:MAG: replicative DNA helicase [Rickettsiales bacterium]|jgi:replicative DNA helicase|nr:replicative DNA helicase [Rickettsiales bacterium]